MNRLKNAALQAMTILLVGLIVSFAHNSFSVNGINPFREIGEVPVVAADPGVEGIEGVRVIDLAVSTRRSPRAPFSSMRGRRSNTRRGTYRAPS